MVKTKIKAAGSSDVGRVRNNNEDAWYLDSERGIYLVVDGIGGQAAGEKAAEIARECVRLRLERQTGSAEERIREAIAIANHEILRQARANPEWQGMACVLTLALLENGSAVIGHVGDSRLYEIRGGQIRKVTHDHSPVGELEDSGQLSEAEAMRHPRRNEVYRDVGSEEHAPGDPGFIEIQRIPFEGDGALLLCSDGLSDLVPSARIREAVERHAGDPEAAARVLIEAANRAGGKDNITIVIAEGERFAGPAPPPAAPSRRPWIAAAIALAAALAGAAAGIAWQRAHTAPPVAIVPRTLTVGAAPGAYPTIGAALAAARPGDTVEVPIGEYHEQIAMRSGVTLRSGVAREAVLLGPVSAEGLRDARLSGFTIRRQHELDGAGIAVSNSAIELDDNEIEGAQTGIDIIGGSGQAVLLGNAVHDCNIGVSIAGPSQPWLSHNSFQRDGVAIVVRDGAGRPSLIGNVFEKSPLELPADMDLKAVWEKNFRLDTASGRSRGATSPAHPERTVKPESHPEAREPKREAPPK